jgi:predicted ArsR family transcriptional regulator
MPPTRFDQRFLTSSRGQVVRLLRRGERTVDELARALGLTDNAVRSHLAALERDGLVRQAGLRRGVSKPAYAYALTPAAERLFPKAYGTLLRLLLDVLAERLPPAALDEALRDVGHRVAAGDGAPRLARGCSPRTVRPIASPSPSPSVAGHDRARAAPCQDSQIKY